MTATLPDLVDADLEQLVNTTDAAAHAGKTPDVIRRWKYLNYLSPAGLDDFGRPLYRLLDVLRVEQMTRNRTAKKKLLPA
jgi:hypothetical protein